MSTTGNDTQLTYSAKPERRDVIVVGGGQAGPAIGYFLAQRGREFTILEATAAPAAAWRGRWHSLKAVPVGARTARAV